LKRRKAGKGSKRFSWTITEDVALLSAASNSAQLIKITDAAGLLASLDSVKERIKYLKVNTECTSQFLNETCPGRGGQKTPRSLESQKSLVDLSRHRAGKRTEDENATVDPATNSDDVAPNGDGNIGCAKRRALENEYTKFNPNSENNGNMDGPKDVGSSNLLLRRALMAVRAFSPPVLSTTQGYTALQRA